MFTGQNVVYVYHNQIDARGDKQATENEIFSACEEAIDEIYALIKRLSTSANTVHFIVTADHGFIYKRDKLTESDKISKVSSGIAFTGKRYYVSESAVEADGVGNAPLSSVLINDDNRIVSFPIASDIFKTAGGGYNYVHGGCSPIGMKKTFQTMIHETAALTDRIFVSAGRVGAQIELDTESLCSTVSAEYADLVK